MPETMQTKLMSQKKFIVIIILVIGLAIGYTIGLSSGRQQLQGQVKQLQDQITKAKKFFPAIGEMRLLSGTIKEINGNAIKVETAASLNPFEEWPTIREVTITDKTHLVKQVMKDPAAYQKEVDAFNKQYQSTLSKGGSTPASPPFPFEQKDITLKDLKPGDIISVQADEDIKTKISFEAVTVTLQSALAGPAAAVPNPVAK